LTTTDQALLREYAHQVSERKLSADPAQQAVIEKLAALGVCLETVARPGYLRRWLAARRPDRFPIQSCRGVYLWGGVGRGKTWMMDLFHAQLPARSSKRVHFQHFMQSVHAKLSRRDHRQRPLELVAAQLARESRVICLDEFFVLDIADAMILCGLIEALLRRGVVLVITSNIAPDKLYEGGLQRERFLPAIAQLKAHLEVVEIAAGTDYRLRYLEAASTYLDSGDMHSETQLDELFTRLAGTSDQGKQTLKIEGRRIAARRRANGMAWFDFSVLCEGPRGTNDYIALAQEMHTVFLSAVPAFTEQQDDAARRFIALVDEFHDRGVKLIVSAAAPPQSLYQGTRLRAAFERTASRLIEMRSRDYLSRAHQEAGERERR
jgi:cell division protein ZapE